MPVPSTPAQQQCKWHQFSWERGEDFLGDSMTKTWHHSWPFMNLMQDAANLFYTGPAQRTAVYVHITALSEKKRKEELWEQYFSQILDCYAFYFHEQSHEDIVMQIKKCKIWLWFDLKKIWDMDNNKIFLKLRNKSSSGNSQGGEKAFIKIHSSLSCSPEPPMH